LFDLSSDEGAKQAVLIVTDENCECYHEEPAAPDAKKE
jgi:hypothetical protein